jgi:hypothetical protein
VRSGFIPVILCKLSGLCGKQVLRGEFSLTFGLARGVPCPHLSFTGEVRYKATIPALPGGSFTIFKVSAKLAVQPMSF